MMMMAVGHWDYGDRWQATLSAQIDELREEPTCPSSITQ